MIACRLNIGETHDFAIGSLLMEAKRQQLTAKSIHLVFVISNFMNKWLPDFTEKEN